jgi:hypothetical protein
MKKSKHPKKRKNSYQNRIVRAVLFYILSGKHKPHHLKLQQSWVGDSLLVKLMSGCEYTGMEEESEESMLEYLLDWYPYILKRIPTACFAHRFLEVEKIVRKTMTENERFLRDVRKKPWEWIQPMTEKWLEDLAHQTLLRKGKMLRATRGG